MNDLTKRLDGAMASLETALFGRPRSDAERRLAKVHTPADFDAALADFGKSVELAGDLIKQVDALAPAHYGRPN